MSLGIYFRNDIKLEDFVRITLNSGAVHTGKVISYDENIVLLEINGRVKPISFAGITDYEQEEPQSRDNQPPQEDRMEVSQKAVHQKTVSQAESKAATDYFSNYAIEYSFQETNFRNERKKAKNEISSDFSSVESSFLNAVKLNELDDKFGRTNKIIASIKALQQEKDLDFYHFALGEVYCACGKLSEAADCYKKAKHYREAAAMFQRCSDMEGLTLTSSFACVKVADITGIPDIFKAMVIGTTIKKDISVIEECIRLAGDKPEDETIKLLVNALIYFLSQGDGKPELSVAGNLYCMENLLQLKQQAAGENKVEKEKQIMTLISKQDERQPVLQTTTPAEHDIKYRMQGKITVFNNIYKIGSISGIGTEIFFRLSGVKDNNLRTALMAGRALKQPVEYTVGESFDAKKNMYNKCAVDITAVEAPKQESNKISIPTGTSDTASPTKEGFIDVYNFHEKYGIINSAGKEYSFLLKSVSDKALAGKIVTEVNISEFDVLFETMKLPGGKTAAINVRPRYPFSDEDRANYEKNAPTPQTSVKKSIIAPVVTAPKLTTEQEILLQIQRNPNNEKYIAEAITFYLASANQDSSATQKALELVKKYEKNLDDERNFLQYIRIYEKRKDYAQLLKYYDLVIQSTEAVSRKLHYLHLKADILADPNKGCLDYQKAIETYQEWSRVKDRNKSILGIKDDATSPYATIETTIRRRLAIAYYGNHDTQMAKNLARDILQMNPSDLIAASILDDTFSAYNSKMDDSSVEDNNDSYGYGLNDFELNDIMQYRLSNFKLSVVFTHVNDLEDGKLKGSITVAEKKIRDLIEKLSSQKPQEYRNLCLAIAKVIDQYLQIAPDNDPLFNKKSRFEYMVMSLVAEGDLSVKTDEIPIDVARYLYLECSAEIQNLNQQLYMNAFVRYLVSFFVERKEIPIGVRGSKNVNQKTPAAYFAENELVDNKNSFVAACTMLFIKKNDLQNQICRQIFESNNQPLIQSILSVIDPNYQSGEKPDWQSFDDIWTNYIHQFKLELLEYKQFMRTIEKIEFSTFWLEQTMEKLEMHQRKCILLSKDNERVKEIILLLDLASRYNSDRDFDNRASNLQEILRRSGNLEKDILEYPTPFAFEAIRHILQPMKTKTEEKLQELFAAFKPELSVEIVSGNTFLTNSGKECEIRFTLRNKSFSQTIREISFTSSTHADCRFSGDNKDYIKGGSEETLFVTVKPTEAQIDNKAFQFDLTVIYNYFDSPTDATTKCMNKEFSINLFNEDDFIEIENPYLAIDTSGEVRNPNMFFGRDDFIDKIIKSLVNKDGTLLRSKCIALFGQKRAGKSSILYHLDDRIKNTYEKSIVIKLGNIQNVLGDTHSKSINSFRYQLLGKLREKLEDHFPELLDKMQEINLNFPTAAELQSDIGAGIFMEFFRNFNKRIITKENNIVILIDEFTYVFNELKKGTLEATFMQLWKAMIQDLEFVAILVGQDYMEKFINDYANPFGTVKKERVTYLSKESARELCDKPIRIIHEDREEESRYKDEKSFERIWQATAGSAFYVVKICSALVNYLNGKKSPYIVEADINNVINNKLLSENDRLPESEFDALFNDEGDIEDKTKKTDNIEILKRIAQMAQKDDYCLRDDIICPLPKERIDMLLQLLCDRDVLEQKDNKYKIKVGLYKEWLIKRYGVNANY